jgi:hypothetical protein
VRGGPPLHIDDADLTRLAAFIGRQQSGENGLRLKPLCEQVEPARSVFNHRRCLRAHRTDACPDVGHGAADEGHARRDARSRLAGDRIDRAERERRVLREPFIVDDDAVGCALLRCRGGGEQRGEKRNHR